VLLERVPAGARNPDHPADRHAPMLTRVIDDLHGQLRQGGNKDAYLGRPGISMTGRTSTVPWRAMGIWEATSIASSRSCASIRK
jgi:hypothetical protein